MTTRTVRTNNVPRNILRFHDLDKAQQNEVINEFGAIDCEEWTGFIYKGNVWNLADFVRTESDGELSGLGWVGVSPQSAFHAVVVKYANDYEDVIVGQVFC